MSAIFLNKNLKEEIYNEILYIIAIVFLIFLVEWRRKLWSVAPFSILEFIIAVSWMQTEFMFELQTV